MEPGEIVVERFEIESLAGSGGMGAVYRAHDRHTDKKVALKVLTGDWDDRFVREARILAELNHPGVVRYVAHGQTAEGKLFLAMEWLEGEDLAERLTYSALTVAESIRLTERAARALAAAHGRGMIHRDIKPSNLFLHEGEIDRVKIVDFGLARQENAARGAVTKTGSLLGTPGYMAPEQARGDSKVDARADVFSLGCVLFECLTGRPPFVGEHVMALLAKILLEDAPRVRGLRPDLPQALDELVARTLSKDPAGRPADAAELADLLARLGPVTGGRPEYAFSDTPSITHGAQRLVFVVLAGNVDQQADSLGHTRPLGSGPTHAETALDRVRAAARVHGGRVEPFANGSVVATFAGSGAATDQAVHAARSALAIRAILPEAPMSCAAGLGDVTTMFAVGEVIDRAARLLQELPPPSNGRARPIRIDEVTAGLLDLRFEVGGDESGLELRGEREVVEATRNLLGKPSPCVGRERELAALDSIFAECTSEPVARAVLVTAPAGVGKSRLRYEFVKRLEQREEPVEIWIGRGDPLSAGSPFAMIAPALRRAAGIRDGEPAPVRRQKLRARLTRVLPASEVQRVAEFVGVLIGTDDPTGSIGGESVQLRAARNDAMLMGDQMRRAWLDWLTAECATTTLVLVLEDLQWGDLPSVQFIDAALRQLGDEPFMVFALARPEVHDVFPRIWSARAVTEMRLGELTRKAGERLVRDVLGEQTQDRVVERIVSQAAGNAFFLEELIRAVAQGKGDELPTTVLAMVQARLLELDEDSRRVLRAASVFGRVFWGGGVHALFGGTMEARTVNERLAELLEREVVGRRPDAKFPNEEEYIFRNALLLESAYAMLTDKDRVLGHRLAAEWLVAAGERDAAVVAEHFERAGEPARALDHYRSAAEQALEGNDLAAALSRAQRAIDCGADGEVLGSLRALQAEAHKWRGENAEAEACGLEALRYIAKGTPAWYRTAGDVMATSARRGNREPLTAILYELEQLEAQGPPSGDHIVLSVRAAIRLLDDGRLDRGIALLDRIEEQVGRHMDDPVVAAWVLDGRATRALFSGDPGEFLRLLFDMVNNFEKAGDFRTACLHRVNAGYAFAQVGAYAEAERVLREALDLAERMGLHHSASACRNNLGLALACRGALDEACKVEREAVAAFQAQGGRRMEGASRNYLAMILGLMGDLENAEKEAQASVEVLENSRPAQAHALARLADIRLRRGNVEGAVTASGDAMRLLEALGGIEDGESLVRLVHAEALHAAGNEEAARVSIADAEKRLLERAERIADPAWRGSFLERVPDNARTRQLAHAWTR